MIIFRRSKTRAGFGMRVVGGTLVAEEASIARTQAELKASLTSPNVPEDKGELDGLTEIAREKLWQCAWGAVRSCVCYEHGGSELALHICQQLKDLYCGGVDGEFRYSHNVKTLLELIVCLARPRTGLSLPPISTPTTDFGGTNLSENATNASFSDSTNLGQANAKLNKIADSQLVRGLMSLLRTIAPVDIVAFSSLMSTLADLTFGRSCIEMTYTVENFGFKSKRCIVLGPVDSKLRSEVGAYMLQILAAKTGSPVATSEKTSDSISPVFTDIPSAWLGVCLEVVVRSFVNELCFRPSMRRSNLNGISTITDRGSGGSVSSPNGKKQSTIRSDDLSSVSGIGGFLSSIGKMLTNSLGAEDKADADPKGELEVNELKSVAEAAFRDTIMLTNDDNRNSDSILTSGFILAPPRERVGLLLNGTYCEVPSDSNDPESISWRPFVTTATDLKILDTCFRYGLRPALISANSSGKPVAVSAKLMYKQQCVWIHVLISVLCIMSPWRETELLSDASTGTKDALDGVQSPAAVTIAESEAASGGIALASDIISTVGAVVTFLIDCRLVLK